jgi:hypothetical protein
MLRHSLAGMCPARSLRQRRRAPVPRPPRTSVPSLSSMTVALSLPYSGFAAHGPPPRRRAWARPARRWPAPSSRRCWRLAAPTAAGPRPPGPPTTCAGWRGSLRRWSGGTRPRWRAARSPRPSCWISSSTGARGQEGVPVPNSNSTLSPAPTPPAPAAPHAQAALCALLQRSRGTASAAGCGRAVGPHAARATTLHGLWHCYPIPRARAGTSASSRAASGPCSRRCSSRTSRPAAAWCYAWLRRCQRRRTPVRCAPRVPHSGGLYISVRRSKPGAALCGGSMRCPA